MSKKYITLSWNAIDYTINNNTKQTIFDFNQKRNIKIWKNSEIVYKFLAVWEKKFEVNIDIDWDNSDTEINILILSKNNETPDWDITVNLNSNFSSVNVKITSLGWEQANINANWNINIAKNVQKSSGHLTQENLYLGEKGTISICPQLNVSSNDIQASHGASVSRISPEKLFYITSKWITKTNWISLIVNSYINNFFEKIQEFDQKEKQVLDYILQ